MLPASVSFDLSHWSQIELRGRDRQTFLNSFCSNDLKKLPAGGACEALIPDIKGKILGHVLIAAGPDKLLLVSVPDSAPGLVKHLSKYVLDADVQIIDVSAERGLLCLWSRNPDTLLAEFGLGDPLAEGQSRELDWNGQSWTVLRADVTVPPGILLSGSRQSLADWRESVPAAVLELGTSALFQILRIEAGFPLWGQDISAEHLAQEAGRTAQAISFTKGCYLGQEPIARLDALGHTNKELRGLVINSPDVPTGSEILHDGEVVGTLTSAAYSPLRQRTVGLAMIRSRAATTGTSLEVRTPAGNFPAEVYWPHLPPG